MPEQRFNVKSLLRSCIALKNRVLELLAFNEVWDASGLTTEEIQIIMAGKGAYTLIVDGEKLYARIKGE